MSLLNLGLECYVMMQKHMLQVTLGVIEENPSSTAGVSNILRHLHNYVPCHGEKLYTIPCHGDGLSVERMRDAMKHNSTASTAKARLQGIAPVPQEFHKKMLLLKVTCRLREILGIM